MTEEEKGKLKPCPLCGSLAYLTTDSETETLYGVNCIMCACNLRPEFKHGYEAIEAWNRRADNE